MKVSHHSTPSIGWLSAPSPAPSSLTISILPSNTLSDLRWQSKLVISLGPFDLSDCVTLWNIRLHPPTQAVKTRDVRLLSAWVGRMKTWDMIWKYGYWEGGLKSLCVCLATCLILSLYLAYHPLCGLSGCSNHQRPCPRSWSRCFSQPGSCGCSSHHW